MPAYVIAQVDIHDPKAYERYRELVPATIAQHGGRYLARGGATQALTGDWQPSRLVILEFPSLEQAQAWWNSPEYTALRKIRESCSDGKILLVQGLAG
jgi:uncharacterized protein (DUF1330 family)